MGAGMPMVSQSSSLDSFQSGSSDAAQAQTYVDENFSSSDDNTTAVQIIVTGDNVLSKSSLLEQIRLQEAIRSNETVGPTLANDSTVGVVSAVAMAADRMEQAESLKARGEKLEERGSSLKARGEKLQERSAALNESKKALEQQGADLKARGSELEQRGERLKERADSLNESKAQLEADAQALKERADSLNESKAQLEADAQALKERADSLNESKAQLEADAQALEERADSLNESKAQLEADSQALEERAQSLNESKKELEQRRQELQLRAQEINHTKAALEERKSEIERREAELEAAIEAGNLTDAEIEQRRKQLAADKAELANDTAALGKKVAELTADQRALKEDANEIESKAATLKADKQALEERGATLEEKGNALKADQQKLEERGVALEEKGNALKADQQKLEERGVALEEKGNALKADQQKLEERGAALEEKGNALKADQQKLEERGAALKEEQARLEAESQELKERGESLKNDSEALKADQRALENASARLKADQRELQNQSTSLSLEKQRSIIESSNESEIETATDAVLGGTNSSTDRSGAFAFMPTSYEPGDTTANATMLMATQTGEGGMEGTASDRLIESQNAIQAIAHDQFGADSAHVFGAGIIADETEQSMTDSMIIVGPLALLFVLAVLIIAYRDLLDILIGLVGIGLVLIWTFGFMGWADIAFNQLFIAVPVLLIGLSIDYAIHVFMRHREERERVHGVRRSMGSALSGIAVALVLVTATAVIGFLSNLTSSVPPIREFGIVSSVGITAALLVFGLFVPALKSELDSFFEARGISRQKRAVGTGGGVLSTVLSGGATAARKAPYLVLLVAVLITAAGGIGATQVDTSFNQEDFLAEDPSGVIADLPEPFAPSEYHAKSSLDFVNDQFLREDSGVNILIRGDMTDPQSLSAIDRAAENASDQPAAATLSNGESDIKSPITVMQTVAAENETFNETFTAADTDGDEIPDRNVEAVYDSLYATAPDRAGGVLQRTDDGYQAAVLSVTVSGDASGQAITDQFRGVADVVESTDGDLSATATGQPIVFNIVQDQLMDTVIESLLLTLGATFLFLMFIYRYLYGSATLGFVTLLPVLFSVAWILGTMYLLGISFNVITGLITSLTIGLGIAYSIHLSERYSLELGPNVSAWDALRTAVTGTGGALLGSAATTVGGFGVLAVAILPPLRQFGIITGLTIIYAFLASVVVLPSLLVVWTRLFGPSDAFEVKSRTTFESGDEGPMIDD